MAERGRNYFGWLEVGRVYPYSLREWEGWSCFFVGLSLASLIVIVRYATHSLLLYEFHPDYVLSCAIPLDYIGCFD